MLDVQHYLPKHTGSLLEWNSHPHWGKVNIKKKVDFFLPEQSVTCTSPRHDESCPHQFLVQKGEETIKPTLMDMEEHVSG